MTLSPPQPNVTLSTGDAPPFLLLPARLPLSRALRVGDTAVYRAVVPASASASSTEALNTDPAIVFTVHLTQIVSVLDKSALQALATRPRSQAIYVESLTPSPLPHWAHAESGAPSTRTTVHGIGLQRVRTLP